MNSERLKKLLAVFMTIAITAIFSVTALAAGNSNLVADLTGSTAATIPTEAFSVLAETVSDIITSEGDETALDFNKDGKADVSVSFQQDGNCLLKRLKGAEQLTQDYTFELPWGAYSKITFKLIVSATGITLDKSELSLSAGGNETLTAAIKPENATNKTIVWASSNEAVATVSNGEVNAVGPGKATIIATTMDGGWTAECQVTVIEKTAEKKKVVISAKKANFVINKAKKYQITLKDKKGNPVKAVPIQLTVNGKTYIKKTSTSGRAVFKLRFNKAGKYKAVIKFRGNKAYKAASKKVTFTVAKQKNTRIYATSKVYKKAQNPKKLSCILKGNNKAIKNVKLTLTVNGKTYSAKTNSSGKATFKINKLKKKGTYTAIIRFAGNSSYGAATKKVRIIVK